MIVMWTDTETTGLIPSVNSIIELAAVVECDGIDQLFVHECMRPDERHCLIDPDALKANGFTMEEIVTFQDSKNVVPALIRELEPFVSTGEKIVLAGQNVSFDRSFIEMMFIRNGHYDDFRRLFSHNIICVQSLTNVCRHQRLVDLDSSKLEKVAAYFGIEYKAHKAINDLSACRKVYKALLSRLGAEETI